MSNEELAVRIQNGEADLMGQLWAQNQGLFHRKAYSLFERYRDYCEASGVTYEDVFQCSYFALIAAVQAFDSQGEHKLTSYLKYPLLNQMRALCGIRTSKRDALNESVSFDEEIGDDDGDMTLHDVIASPSASATFDKKEDDIYNSELRAAFEVVLDELSANHAAVIRKRYFDCETQNDIAADMGVIHQRVHLLEREALRKLRKNATLQTFYDETLSRLAYKNTGLQFFREHWESSVEHAVITLEKITERRERQTR